MHDFVIVGSGVAGGRLSYDLTRAGASCVLLEAGREFNKHTFPKNELDTSAQIYWGGGRELSRDGRLGFLRGKCVGGTSVVHQALLSRLDDLALEDWRTETGIGFFNSERFDRLYEEVESDLSVAVFSRKSFNQNAEIFTHAFDRMGLGWTPLCRAHRNCALEKGSDCIVCLGGCPRDSKQSALITTIRKARELGLRLESEFEVERIEDRRDHVVVKGLQRGTPVSILGRRVFLAAGSLGSTSILLKSGFGSKLPALGKRFTCHPQVTTYARFNHPIQSHRGAFQTVGSHDSRLRRMGLKLENGSAPPIGAAKLMPGLGQKHQDRMRDYSFYASMGVSIQDDAVGRIQLDRKGRLIVDKPFTRSDREKLSAGRKITKELFEAAGATEVLSTPEPVGMHLMGGCPIGTDPQESVVNPNFSVFGHPNIRVADSSVFPSAPGINPSLTILALAHMAAKTAVERGI